MQDLIFIVIGASLVYLFFIASRKTFSNFILFYIIAGTTFTPWAYGVTWMSFVIAAFWVWFIFFHKR
jgi:hypothetical protein